MYARVFAQILDSSISRNYLTRLVFMDCLLLADEDGILDITADAIARRTNIPLHIVLEAISSLSEPDPDSRSGAEEGRRLVLLDPHRNWGWRIVNHAKYRVIKTREDKRTYDQNRYAQSKNARKSIALNDSTKFHSCSQNSTDSTHSDSDVDVLKTCSPDGERRPVPPSLDNLAFDTLDNFQAPSSSSPSSPTTSPVLPSPKESASAKDSNWGKRVFRESFWPAWPRKVAKADAERAWLRHATTPEIAETIVKAAKDQTATLTADGMKYCPYPATWLNGRRYEDDPAEAPAQLNGAGDRAPGDTRYPDWNPGWESAADA
jgi:hypothetical protein